MADAHLLDGMLGRALAYAGLAMIAGPPLWHLVTHSACRHRLLVRGGLLSAMTGALVSLHAVTLMAFSPFVPESGTQVELVELGLGLQDYLQILSSSTFGKAWLIHVGTFLTAALVSGYDSNTYTRAWAALSLVGASVAGLALMGHAGDFGWLSWRYVTDLIHLAVVLTWLAGFGVIILDRLGGYGQLPIPVIRQFSWLAGWLMAIAIVSGLLRLYLQDVPMSALPWDVYGWVLAGKLLALAGVLLSAYGLRRWLTANKGKNDPSWRHFDDLLSAEFFFAAVMILMAALLTQLPPPPPDPVPAAVRAHPAAPAVPANARHPRAVADAPATAEHPYSVPASAAALDETGA